MFVPEYGDDSFIRGSWVVAWYASHPAAQNGWRNQTTWWIADDCRPVGSHKHRPAREAITIQPRQHHGLPAHAAGGAGPSPQRVDRSFMRQGWLRHLDSVPPSAFCQRHLPCYRRPTLFVLASQTWFMGVVAHCPPFARHRSRGLWLSTRRVWWYAPSPRSARKWALIELNHASRDAHGCTTKVAIAAPFAKIWPHGIRMAVRRPDLAKNHASSNATPAKEPPAPMDRTSRLLSRRKRQYPMAIPLRAEGSHHRCRAAAQRRSVARARGTGGLHGDRTAQRYAGNTSAASQPIRTHLAGGIVVLSITCIARWNRHNPRWCWRVTVSQSLPAIAKIDGSDRFAPLSV